MPYLTIRTNQNIEEETGRRMLYKASALIAKELGKSENYVMASLEPPALMLFGGNDAALAYLELKSIGLPEQKTKELSETLCTLLEEEVGIARDRIYIEFSNAERHLWGWNGTTF